MSVNVVQKNGKDYYQWNKKGRLYPTEAKALRQGRAEKARGRNKT